MLVVVLLLIAIVCDNRRSDNRNISVGFKGNKILIETHRV